MWPDWGDLVSSWSNVAIEEANVTKPRVSYCGKDDCGGRRACLECRRIARANREEISEPSVEEAKPVEYPHYVTAAGEVRPIYGLPNSLLRPPELEAKVGRIMEHLDKLPETTMCSVGGCGQVAGVVVGRQGYCVGHSGVGVDT